MKATAYLFIEPVIDRWGDRVVGAKIMAVRQTKPPAGGSATSRAVELILELPDDFFTPPRIETVVATVEYDTPESAGIKVERAVAVAQMAQEVDWDEDHEKADAAFHEAWTGEPEDDDEYHGGES